MSKNNVHLQHDLRGFGSRLDSFLDNLDRQDKTRASGEQFETVRPSKQAARNLSSGASGDAIRAVTGSQTQTRS